MNIIVGPSHVVRLQRELSIKREAKILNDYVFICKGGVPVWCDYIEENLEKSYSANSQAYIIVGDFRFGNKAVANNVSCTAEHYGIDKNSISLDVDVECYNKALVTLDRWVKKYNVKLLFWDLALREYKNKKERKYIDDSGVYHHPVWNLNDVEQRYRHNVLSMRQPCETIPDLLEIDSSNHPSHVGYSLIKSLFFDQLNVSDSILNSLSYCSEVSAVDSNQRMILCGVSPLYREISLYARKNLLKLNNIDVFSAEDALFNKFRSCDTILYFANEISASSLRFLPKSKYRNKFIVCKEDGYIHVYVLDGTNINFLKSYPVIDEYLEITGDKLNFLGIRDMMSKIIDIVEEDYG